MLQRHPDTLRRHGEVERIIRRYNDARGYHATITKPPWARLPLAAAGLVPDLAPLPSLPYPRVASALCAG